MPDLRDLFKPQEGATLTPIDYSQLEVRIMTQLMADEELNKELSPSPFKGLFRNPTTGRRWHD